MEADEVIWIETAHNSCTLKPMSMDILCVYFERGGIGCTARVNGAPVCEGKPRVALNKQEYLTWKLTK